MNVSGEHSIALDEHGGRERRAAAELKDDRADVVVVGAGIAGLSVAYELTKAGRSVIILDRPCALRRPQPRQRADLRRNRRLRRRADHRAVAGLLLRDLILGRGNPWAQAYTPQRVTLRAAADYVRDNATMVASFGEYVTGGDVSSLDQIKPGQGAVVRQGTAKIPAYRDEGGQLHLRSAACMHANCIVHWNAFETCWDCPCHGSQFSIDGEPINGSATSPLAAAPR